jgi:hypothetical protein
MARRKAPRSIESYIKAALRRVWGWHKERDKALNRATNGRRTKWSMYRCEECGVEELPRKSVQVDHTDPVEDTSGFDGDWTGWINRLFVDAAGLKILCKPCHQKKTNAENVVRRKARKAK